MIKVYNTIKVYEENDRDVSLAGEELTVSSHWTNDKLVVITIKNKSSVTTVTNLAVKASDLLAAIANATNTARF